MRARVVLAAVALAVTCAAAAVLADWLQPDPSYRDAQFLLRMALRDTVGQQGNVARLDTLGLALLRLGRFTDAESVYRRALALEPGDLTARAGLGKMALFAGRVAEAESLLAPVEDRVEGALRDLFDARLRRGDFAAAAGMADQVGEAGRVQMLERMADQGVYEITAGLDSTTLRFSRSYPVPLVRVRLNGQSVLMAIDTGADDILVDESVARRVGVKAVGGDRPAFWNGSRIAVRNAIVQRLDLQGMRLARLPAGIYNLHRYSIEVNPHGENIGGIIGLGLMRRFTPTLDFKRLQLELRRPAVPYVAPAGARRIPFQIWGENELTVYGTLNGGRRMAMVVQSGMPACGVGAPAEVFEEIGVKPGMVSRLVKGAGAWLQGRPWTAVVVPTVSVGAVVRDRVPGWSDAMDSAELWRYGVRRDALLAGEFFGGLRVTIDWTRHELVIEEP